MADRLRQIEVELAELRQHTMMFGIGEGSPHTLLRLAGGQILKASDILREAAAQEWK